MCLPLDVRGHQEVQDSSYLHWRGEGEGCTEEAE